MSGLKNRFNKDDLRQVWLGNNEYTCLWCGRNHADAFHHIISPSSIRFIEGQHNSSVLNSCPICNYPCHIGNSELHKEENEKMLLQKVIRIVLESDYKLKEKDDKFISVYVNFYK